MTNIKKLAIDLLDAGYNIIPINEGEKTPHRCLGKTHKLFEEKASKKEIDTWFSKNKINSIGLVNGAISNNLVTLDFDEVGFYDDWFSTLKAEHKVLVEKFHKARTRGGGEHLRFKAQTPQSTKKLACRKVKTSDDKQTIETIAEVRGNKSYALIPPTADYTTLCGDLLNLPTVTDPMYLELLETFKPFNEVNNHK
jgi:Bifunctional DNA primase/polymerase, N-terminal